MEDIVALKQAQLPIELSPNTAHFTVESALHRNSIGTTIVKLRYAIRPLVIDANLSEADRNRNNSGRECFSSRAPARGAIAFHWAQMFPQVLE
jgi:hypothetical protein